MLKDLFGAVSGGYENFTVFQDEADCKESNFFYHGFLFVNNKFGRNILNKLTKVKRDEGYRDTEISFKDIKCSSESKFGYKTRIALQWLSLSDELLRSGKIRFYLFGVNKNNLGNFWRNDWSYKKNIYLRFFEMGLKSSVMWFSKDKNLNLPLRVSHVFYEHGNYDDERRNKIQWLSTELRNSDLEEIIDWRKAKPLLSNEEKSRDKFSNLIQLTDLILGCCKYSFVEAKHEGRKECIERLIKVIEEFNNTRTAYNFKGDYWRKFCMQFFPKRTITEDEFLSKDNNYIKKSRGIFYYDRLTYRQQKGKERQLKLL